MTTQEFQELQRRRVEITRELDEEEERAATIPFGHANGCNYDPPEHLQARTRECAAPVVPTGGGDVSYQRCRGGRRVLRSRAEGV